MVSLSLGQIAEQAGVRPPGSSSNWKSRSSGEETPGTAAGIASGYATSRVPKILEPAPVTGSASSGSTVGLAAPAPQAERSASATDLYERAIRGAELGGRTHQQHGSDPVRPVARSTSTPPDERSSAPAPHQHQQQQHGQEQVQQHGGQTRAASPHLHPPQSGHVNFSQQPSRIAQRDGAAARQSSSGQGSDNSPNSDPSPGSHASTSIIPEHHRVYTTPYMSPNQAGPYGHGMSQAGPGSTGHFSASSSPSYIQHHHQQQNASYAYHTQYYAPQYHYPPPNDGSQAFYAVNNAGSPHSPIHDPQAGMAPQTFYPQTYYYSTGQVLHTAASSPNTAAALTLDDGTLSHYAYSDDMSNNHHARPFSAQSAHQSFGQQSHHQQHQQHPHAQQRMQPGMSYQVSHQPGMPYVTYTSGHHSGNQMMGSTQLPNPSYAQPQYQYQPMNNPPMSPILGHTYTYNQQGNPRPSVDMGQHQYRPVQFSPVSPQAFTSPPLGEGGAGGQQHLRYSTVDSAFSASTPYTNMEQSGAQSSAYTAQGSRGATNGQSSQRPTELARGHLAQSKFREALGAYDPNARLPISANEHKRAASGDSRLPKPPSHSPWAMWVGNVPSDATHSELWRFFSSRPPPGKPIPDSEEEKETLASEALYTAPDESQPDYDTVGIESVHLISRSNCCFVNMASKRHLDHAIKVSHGLSLRPHDPRCKPLVCRIRKKDDDNKTGVGAQRGKGMHQAWAAEKEKVKGLADAEAEIAAIVTGDAPSAVSIAVGSDGQLGHNGSASTIHSISTSSTTSSFLTRHFPRRYFILKSHSEDDLHMSVERGLWATQSHNEPVLDQAYRTAQNVFLIFGANKSGEFFGYAKMAGPIHKLEKRSSRSSSLGQEIEGSSSSGGKSGSSASRRPEPSIAETPEDETTEDVQPPPNLSVPSVQYVLSPSGVVSNSPQPLSTADTPAQAKLAEDDVDYLSIKAPQHFTAPSPMIGEKGALEARKAESLDPSVLARLASVDISQRDRNSEPLRLSSSPLGMAIASKTANDQLLAGSSSRPGQDDEGVFRKDTLLSPEERNARLEMLETQQDAGHTALASNGETSLKDAMEQGTSKPFKIEWIRVQKLPFYRTRHLRNAFNGNREVKISRDGTEIEPDVGQQLLELFWKDPALTTSQPTSPRTNATSMISPMLS